MCRRAPDGQRRRGGGTKAKREERRGSVYPFRVTLIACNVIIIMIFEPKGQISRADGTEVHTLCVPVYVWLFEVLR